MILGLGIDLLEHRRVEQELSRGKWLLGDGVFTPAEIHRSDSTRKPALAYAACFAAKEAALKALGLRVENLGMLQDVELLPQSGHRSSLTLRGRAKAAAERLGARRIHVCLARSGRHTSAAVILED